MDNIAFQRPNQNRFPERDESGRQTVRTRGHAGRLVYVLPDPDVIR